MSEKIAGHRFNAFGVCTEPRMSGEGCPVRWGWLARQCRGNASVINEYGYAHLQVLTPSEYAEVTAADDAEQTRMMEGIYDAAAG